MRITIQLVLLILSSLTLSAQQITYYIQGLHRQGNAPDARTYLGVTNLAFAAATNSNAGIVSALQYVPATNSNPGITSALGYVPATNTTAGIVSALGYTPATNGPFNDTVWVLGTSLVVGWPFVASTCSITSNSTLAGFLGVVSNMTVYGTLSITNATGTTWTLTMPGTVKTPDGVIVAYCTNGTGHEFNFKIGPSSNMIHFPSF